MTLRLLRLSLASVLIACTAARSHETLAPAAQPASPRQSCAHTDEARLQTEQPGTFPTAWSDADIRASRTTLLGASQPVREVPKNLLAVFEAGECLLTMIDTERWEVVKRFPVRAAPLKAVQVSPDGRYFYVGAQNGWVTQYDLRSLTVVAQVRVGVTLRHLALSNDGRYLAAANDAPMNLVLLGTDLQPIKQIDISTLDGKRTSRIAALHNATPRKSFVAALEDVAEVWEISYDENAAPIFDGYVHDYRMGEAIAKPGFLNARRTPLEFPLADFAFDTGHHNILGSLNRAFEAASTTTLHAVNLDARRKIAELSIPGLPNVSGGLRFKWNERSVFVCTNREKSVIHVIDLQTWKIAKTIPISGPGLFVGSNERSRYAWADALLSQSARDTLTLIDKQTLEPVAALRSPGSALEQAAFTPDGRSLLASIPGIEGAIVVFDVETRKEIKRLPMRRPEGVYPLWNQIPYLKARPH